MKLFELFNAPTSHTWATDDEPGGATATFDVEGHHYIVGFIQQRDPGEWEVEFSLDTGDANVSRRFMINQTGTGSEIKVFSAVIGAINDFAVKYKPTSLLIYGIGEGRARLYTKMFAKYAGNWNVTNTGDASAGVWKLTPR